MWIQIEHPKTGSISIIDGGEIEGARKQKDGTIILFMRSGRVTKFAGAGDGGKWIEEIWGHILRQTDLGPKKQITLPRPTLGEKIKPDGA